MEQTPSLPGRSPELPSVSPPSSGEALGGNRNHENVENDRIERQESKGETVSAQGQAPAIPPTVASAPLVKSTTAVDDTTSSTVLPSVANDDDLIEKEWVDKTKKVLAETKDDPYRREQEVNRIQSDYLFKRYGRELGSTK